jgi:hypothetical protein
MPPIGQKTTLSGFFTLSDAAWRGSTDVGDEVARIVLVLVCESGTRICSNLLDSNVAANQVRIADWRARQMSHKTSVWYSITANQRREVQQEELGNLILHHQP